MFDLGRTFIASVERSPNAEAIVDGETRLTYAAWHREICRVLSGLDALGLRPGDHLLVALQNRVEMASLHWACQLAGVIITPLNWRAKADELDYCAADAEVCAVVFQDVTEDAVSGSPSAQRIPRIAVGGAAGGTLAF